MLINGRVNQRRVNLIKILDSMLKDHSISFLNYREEDTFRDWQKVVHKKLWLSNQMVMILKYGGSIKGLRQSRISNSVTILLTSMEMEVATIWMLEILLSIGGNNLDMSITILRISETVKL